MRFTWQQEFWGDSLCLCFSIPLFEASRKCIFKTINECCQLLWWFGFPTTNEITAQVLEKRRSERLTDGSAKIKSLQRWEPGRCDLICMLQKAWALLSVVSTKGTGVLGGLERRGHGWLQGLRWWLITLTVMKGSKDERQETFYHCGRKEVFPGVLWLLLLFWDRVTCSKGRSPTQYKRYFQYQLYIIRQGFCV